MSVINITNFTGESPRTPIRNLNGGAQINQNLLATATEFRPLLAAGAPLAGIPAYSPKTIYRTQRGIDGALHASETSGWQVKSTDMSYVKGQVADDTTERTYYTTDDGSAPPRVFNNKGEDYLLGIPRPPKPEVSMLTTSKFTYKRAKEWVDSTLLPLLVKYTLESLDEDQARARYYFNTPSPVMVPGVGNAVNGFSRAGATKLYNSLNNDGNYFMYWPSLYDQAPNKDTVSQRGMIEPWNILFRIPEGQVCDEGLGNPLIGGIKINYMSAYPGDNNPTWFGVNANPLWGVLNVGVYNSTTGVFTDGSLADKISKIIRPDVDSSTEPLWMPAQVQYMAGTIEALLHPSQITAVKTLRSQLDESLKAVSDAGYWSAKNAAKPTKGSDEEQSVFDTRLAEWKDHHASCVAAVVDAQDECAKISQKIEAIYFNRRDNFLTVLSDWFSNVRLEKTSDDTDGLLVLDNDTVVDTRFYVTTYVTEWGEESSPSEPSDQLDVYANDLIVVKDPPRDDVSAGRNITKWRLYRSNSGSSSTAFQFVEERKYSDAFPAPYSGWGNLGPSTLKGFGDPLKWRDVVATWVIYTNDRGVSPSESIGAFRSTDKLRIGDTVLLHNGYGATGIGATYKFRKTWNGHAWVAQQVPSVSTYSAGGVCIDGKSGEQLGETCPTTTWSPPPYRFDATVDPLPRIPATKGANPHLRGLVGMTNGVMAGFIDNFVAFSEAYSPYAWPVEYQIPIEYPIVGLCPFGQSLFVGTKATPYIMSGADPASMSSVKLNQSQSCISAKSMVSAMGGVFYASPDGYCFANLSGVEVATTALFSNEDWTALNPSSIFAAVHDSVLYFWYTKLDGTKGCYGLDMVARKLARHDHLDATAVFEDVVTDSVFVGTNNGVRPLFRTGRQVGLWRSGRIVLPKQTPFSWIKCVSDASTETPVTVNWYADGVRKVIIYDGSVLPIVKDYTHQAIFTDNEPQRLPDGRYLEHEIEITSKARITQVIMASTTEELKAS